MLVFNFNFIHRMLHAQQSSLLIEHVLLFQINYYYAVVIVEIRYFSFRFMENPSRHCWNLYQNKKLLFIKEFQPPANGLGTISTR